MKAKPKTTLKTSNAKTKSGKVINRRPGEERVWHLASLVNGISDALISTDMQFNILEWNAAAENMYGWTEAEVTGHLLQEFVQSEYVDITRGDVLEAILKQGIWQGEVTQKHRDGRQILVLASVSHIKDEIGNPIGFVAINRDITERKQAEKQVIQMKRLYATLSQVNQTIVRVKNRDELYQNICDIAVRFGEFSLAWVGLLDEAIGDVRPVAAKGFDVNHWAFPIANIHTGPLSDGLVARALRTSNIVTVENMQNDEHLQVLRDLFHEYGFHASAVIPFRLRGRVIGTLTLISPEIGLFKDVDEIRLLDEMGLDISFALDTMETKAERRQTENNLQASEHKLKLFVEYAPAAIAMFDRDMRYIAASQRYLVDYRLADQDISGRLHYEIFPEVPERWKETHRRCLEGATEKADEDPFPRADGSMDWVRWEIHPWYEQEGKIGGIILFSEVITEHKHAEEEHHKSEKKFSDAFHKSPAAMTITRIADGTFIDANEVFLNTFEFTRAEVIGHTSIELNMLGPEARRLLIERQLATGGLQNAELKAQSKSGRTITILFSSSSIDINNESHHITTMIDITELKQIEEKLNLSETRYRRLFEAAKDGILILDAETGMIADVNPFLVTLLGYSKEAFLGKNIWELGFFKDIIANKANFLELQQKEYIRYEDLPLKTASGEQINVEFVSNVYEAGHQKVIQCNIRDITERKRAEEIRAQLAAIVESSDDAIIGKTLDGIISSWNKGAEKVYGYMAAEVVGTSISILVPPDQPDELPDILKRLRRGESINHYETVRLRKDGQRIHVSLTVSPIRDSAGNILAASTIARDITERKQAEDSIRLAEHQYRLLFEESPVMVVLTEYSDTNIIIAKCNQQFLSTLGYDQDEVIGKSLTGFYSADSRVELEQSYSHTIAGIPLSEERELIARDGRIVPVLLRAVPRANAEGTVIGTQASYIDITERKRAEEKIQRQLEHLNSLRAIDTAISSSFDIHVTLAIVLQQVLSQLGADAAAILLLNPQMQMIEYAASRGFHSDVLRHTQLELNEGYAGRAVHEHKTIHIPALLETGGKLAKVMQSANENFVEYYGTPLISKDGIKGVLEIYHHSRLQPDSEWLDFLETLAGQAAIAIDNAQLFDSLQRSNAELEQRVAQRTAELNQANIELEHANKAKDEFLATMSHELRTPLNSILGLSETLLEQRRDPLSDHQQKSLQTIASSGEHLLELINDILDLSKIEAGKFDYHPQIVGVDDLCRSSLAFVKEQATRKSITLTYQNQQAVSKIFADPRRLKQIMVNLLTNAVKFTPDHGQVTLGMAWNFLSLIPASALPLKIWKSYSNPLCRWIAVSHASMKAQVWDWRWSKS